MAELYVGSKVKGYKQTIFYKENGGTGSEIIEISMKVSGKKSQEIMKRAEESTDKLLDNIRELLKEEQQEAVQEKDLSVRYKCDGKKEKCQKKFATRMATKGKTHVCTQRIFVMLKILKNILVGQKFIGKLRMPK